jgi:hypothetical protein
VIEHHFDRADIARETFRPLHATLIDWQTACRSIDRRAQDRKELRLERLRQATVGAEYDQGIRLAVPLYDALWTMLLPRLRLLVPSARYRGQNCWCRQRSS